MEVMMNQGQMEIPAGGIGDIAALSEQDVDQIYASEFGEMAAQGRGGDTMLAHVSPGEMVIPAEFLEDPAIKQRFVNFLSEQGVEDPERYIVGSDSNSINPVTGLAEFFLSSLWKGVKKIAKKVVKVVKKAAGVILPAMLAATPLGPVYGAALGSGVATLVQGGNFKDALKSGLMGGATGALSTLATGGNLRTAVQNPGDRFRKFGYNVQRGGIKAFTRPIGYEQTKTHYDNRLKSKDTVQTPALKSKTKVEQPSPEARAAADRLVESNDITQGFNYQSELDKFGTYELGKLGTPKLDQITPTLDQIAPKINSHQAVQAAQGGGNAVRGIKGEVQKFLKNPIVKNIGNQSLYGGLIAGALSGEDKEEEGGAEEFYGTSQYPSPNELLRRHPDHYMFANLGGKIYDPQRDQYIEPTGFSPLSNFELQSETPIFNRFGEEIPQPQQVDPQGIMNVAHGGEIFPRRNGGIMPHEGIPNEDSVRAMLMPGEFVMTRDAVRGMGRGDLGKGIKNMYSVMRSLEARDRRAS